MKEGLRSFCTFTNQVGFSSSNSINLSDATRIAKTLIVKILKRLPGKVKNILSETFVTSTTFVTHPSPLLVTFIISGAIDLLKSKACLYIGSCDPSKQFTLQRVNLWNPKFLKQIDWNIMYSKIFLENALFFSKVIM